MSDRRDVSVETLREPPIGSAARPRTSSDPDAAVLPRDDGALAPGERANTKTPSTSSTRDRQVPHEDRIPFLNSNEQLLSAPVTQTMNAEREELTMDPLHEFYNTLDSLYACWFPLLAHGDSVVAHNLARDSPASFDTPAGQSFKRKGDIMCLPGCWKPTLKICSFACASQILGSTLSATSSALAVNVHSVLSLLAIGSIVYLGGSHRQRMIEAHGLREPPCRLGCCALAPPFNPYCCWFWWTWFAAAQERKAILRILRRRAIDAEYNGL